MRPLTQILCLPILTLLLSANTVIAASTDEITDSNNQAPVYQISVLTLKSKTINRARRNSLKLNKISRIATQMGGEVLGATEQPQNGKLTLVIKLANKALLRRFQKRSNPYYVELRKNVVNEYRFIAVASDAIAAQSAGYQGPFIKVMDVKGQYPKSEFLMSGR